MRTPVLTLLLLLAATGLFAQMPNTLSKTDKIYGLSKFWQEVNYNFVYLEKVDREAWDADYRDLIEAVQHPANDYEYYRLLQKFCALLHDGHTNVYFPRAVQDSLFTSYFGDYRLFLTNIEGRAIVTRVNASKKEEIPVGTEIIRVNGLPAAEYARQYVRPYIASSTAHILDDWSIQNLLQAPTGTRFDLELKLPDGSLRQLQLTHSVTLEKEVYPPFENGELLEMKWLTDEIAYVALNSFSDYRIDSIFIFGKLPELYRAKKLIIDLRKNGGGSTDIGLAIFLYLTNDSVLYGSKMQSRLHIPSYKAWGVGSTEADSAGGDWSRQAYLSYRDRFYHDFPYEADTIRSDAPRLVVPTVLLIGHQTASAAEDFLIYAANQPHMVRIGTPTFGSTGQPLVFDLPGGGRARVCTKKDTYPDGREFVGYGIQPDILVRKTLEDYLNGRDPELEAALQYLEKQ